MAVVRGQSLRIIAHVIHPTGAAVLGETGDQD